MKRDTKLFSINNIPLLIYDSPECISDDIVKYNNFWEFELFNKWKHYFPTKGLFFDIGANIGNHCVQFKYNFPDIEIWAFEPYLENYLLLKQNTKSYKDIKCFNIGVGSKTSIVCFSDGSYENSGVVKIVNQSDNNNIVLKLDDLLIEKPVSFIKIDIEGHEYSAFEGMLNLLKKDKPMIWVEDNEQVAVPYLQSLGYNILEKNELTEDYLMI
jgi:FkbM family methyltransferase